MSVAALKQQLADHLAPAHLARPPMPTGIAALDAALPGGGLPRGRLTEIVGTRGWGGGKATVARRIAESALGRGEWVAYIDATRTLAPRDWAHLGAHEGLWMVRPHDPARAAWCADVILRSGAFSLLVIDGAPTLARQLAVRLTHLARESGAALLVIAPDGAAEPKATLLGGALRLKVQRGRRRPRKKEKPMVLAMTSAEALDAPRPRSMQHAARSSSSRVPSEETSLRITIEKGGTTQRIEVHCAVGMARRLCTHPEIPDRRGVARREGRPRGGAAVAAAGGAGSAARSDAGGERQPERREPGASRTLARSRRCAEPDYGRESGAARAIRAARGRARTLG